jgi:microcystin degradation protein MlrC
MRIGLIQVMQETCSFNPTPTTLGDFASFGILRGADVLERSDTAGPIAGYLEGVRMSGCAVDTVAIVRGTAQSGGRLTREAFDHFDTVIRDGLADAGDLDGVVMLLHGAASADGIDDVEGALLATARSVIGPDVPLALMLDHHANVTRAIVEHADVLMGFRTQPHDQFETARDLTRLAIRLAAAEISPTTAWRKLRMLTHQEQYLTARGPMKVLFDRAREIEGDPRVLTVSPFPMQCWLDADEAGWAVVVVTDDDPALADQLADELADLAWSMRDDFQVTESVSVDEAVRLADTGAHLTGPTLLSDTGDSVLGGSGGDSTVILEAILRLGIEGRALVPMIDPVSAVELTAAGVGATVTLAIGGRSTPLFHPLEVTGVVRAVGDGLADADDLPQGRINMGRCAAFDVGPVTLLVTEFAGAAGIHPASYRHLGVEPGDHRMIVMKTASNFQYMAQLTTTFIRVATPGPTQSDLATLPWERAPRPIFPLDPTPSWRG